MNKLIALIIAFVSCAAAPYVWLNNALKKELKLEEELRQYRKIQANNDITALQQQLHDALLKPNVRCDGYEYEAAMLKQMELLNKMYARI